MVLNIQNDQNDRLKKKAYEKKVLFYFIDRFVYNSKAFIELILTKGISYFDGNMGNKSYT